MRTVDRLLTEAVAAGRVPGAVAAVGSAAGAEYFGAYGAASIGAGIPMRPDSVFRIASMTKLVTSVAVMILVDEGRVDLDSPLAAYVPGFRQPDVLDQFDPQTGRYSTRPAARDATVRELLSHTAGYGYWFLHEPLHIVGGSEPDLVNPPFLMYEPGTVFAYSTSTDVAALLFEPVAGLPLDRFFAERIFAPLGLRDTSYALPADLGRFVRVHRRSGTGFRELPLEAGDHPVRGGGGLNSTAADYARLLQCLLRGGELEGVRLLRESSVAEIARNQIGALAARAQRTALANRSNDFIFMDGSQKFGLGVMIETRDKPGGRSTGSFSWGGIFNTYFWVDPPRDIAAVLMLQLAPFASRASVELLRDFETAVYGDWQARGKQ